MENTINNNSNSIINRQDLISFRNNRRMRITQIPCADHESGEMSSFLKVEFIGEGGAVEPCGFSSKLEAFKGIDATKAAQLVKEMRHELQVVTLSSGSHIICKQGANTVEVDAWED